MQFILSAQCLSAPNVASQIQISGFQKDIYLDEINWPDNVSISDRNIYGNINLSQQKLNRTLNVSVDIINCTVFGDVNLGNANFTKGVCFHKTKFKKNAIFSGSKFLKNLSFSKAVFMKDASFNDIIVIGPSDFNGSEFMGEVIFGDDNINCSRFMGDFCFIDVVIGGKSLFKNANFNGRAIFNHSTFKGDACFDNASFSEQVSFLGVTFEDKSYFRGANFLKLACFALTRFNQVCEFYDPQNGAAIFWGNANFVRSKFSEDAIFQGTHFKKNANFTQAEFEKDWNLRNVNFESGLSMNESGFNNVKVSWDSIDQLEFDGSVYLNLIKNFKNNEKFDEADRCYDQYRLLSQRKKGFTDPTFYTDLVAYATCSYGTRVSFIIIWVAALILIGACSLWHSKGLAIEIDPHDVHGDEERGRSKKYARSPKNFESILANGNNIRASMRQCLYFSAAMFIGYKPEKMHAQGSSEYIAIGLRLAGWFFMALFLVVLGRLMIR
jgi:hypothetical protein